MGFHLTGTHQFGNLAHLRGRELDVDYSDDGGEELLLVVGVPLNRHRGWQAVGEGFGLAVGWRSGDRSWAVSEG